LAVVLASALIVACGDDDDSTDADASSSPPTTVPCPGEAVRFTTIASLTGSLAFGSVARDIQEGIKAAATAVNRSCGARRPIEIDVCDDKSDPNESQACGRRAAERGSIALFGWLGRSDNGATAAEGAGLPSLLTRNQVTWELTSKNAYPATSILAVALGSIGAAAGTGADDYLFIAYDDPVTRAAASLFDGLGKNFGIDVNFLYVPADTTDFASVAAQVAERRPGAIAVVVPAIVPLMNALNAEGVTPTRVPMFTSTDIIPPEVLHELGDKLEGYYLSSDIVPPQDTRNPGIRQMLEEYRAAGIKTKPADMGSIAVLLWSKVHILAETIGGLSASARDALDGQALADALIARGRISRPELAAFDLSHPAFPDLPLLSNFRVFSDQAMLVQIKGGTYRSVSGFRDVRKPAEISGG
jgi:ABC-type branched-subunit amino acid transport system substrate-binding protein